MNNSVFGKTMENVKKLRDIKLITTGKRINQLVSEPNYHTTNWFSENLLALEIKQIKLKMNKPVYLGLSILEISKTLMYKFWYEYMKPNYGDNVKLCYMDTDSFIMHIKTEDFLKILLMMLKNGLTHQFMMLVLIDHYQPAKKPWVYELGGNLLVQDQKHILI